MGSKNGEGNCKVVDVMECNYQGRKESQLRTRANICVLVGRTFPAAEMVKGSRNKSGTISFRYKRNYLIMRAVTQAIE